MELRQLEIFRALSEELNFTRTAERVHCVQSNVTTQIRSLEAELVVPLFERLGKQVRLTEHGRRLVPYAERILRLLEEARLTVTAGDEPTGALDTETSAGIMDLMVQLNRQNQQTFVWVTHSEEVGALAQRLIRMRDGLIVSDTMDPVVGVDGSDHNRAPELMARVD